MSIFVSVLTGGSSDHETTSEELNAASTDFTSEGVVGAVTNTSGVAPATGAFAVNAQGTPAMAVDVSTGTAYVTATPSGQSSQLLRVRNAATEAVTIAANSSGSTKYDWIYISISAANAANPNAAADNVATLVTSRSSSSSSDDGTPPTYGYPIAVVTVANGASSITNGNIADVRTVTGPTPADGSVTPVKLDTDAIGHGFLEIGRTTLGSAGDTLSVASLPTRKYLKFYAYIYVTGTVTVQMRLNNDSGNNYGFRYTLDNGVGSGSDAANNVGNYSGSGTVPLFIQGEFINVATVQKLGWQKAISAASGANRPSYVEFYSLWNNTASAISRIDFINTNTGDFAVGSELVVLGRD